MSNNPSLALRRPQPSASVSRRPGLETHPITRAVFAAYLAKARGRAGQQPAEIAKQLWPNDIATSRVIARSAVDPMNSADQSVLAQTTVGGFFSSLPQSAGANLIAAGLEADMQRSATITMPFRDDEPIIAPFVGEDGAIQVRQGALDSVLLGPIKKAGSIFAVSREVALQPGAEAMLRRLLAEDAAVTLDAAFFSDAAADDDRPAGLLNGVTAIAGYSGGDGTALREDMGALSGAVADGGGSGALAIVLHPKRAARLQLLMPDFPWQVWPSRAVAEDRVICLDPTGFVSAFGDGVDIMASQTATLHMSDTPLPIVSEGGATADPVRSVWQTDSVAIRLLVWMTFAMRGNGLVQYVTGASW